MLKLHLCEWKLHPTARVGIFHANESSIRIGAEGFGSDIDKAAKEKVTWFRDKDHHAITFGIGQIREAEVELDALQKVLAHPVKASFTAARGHYDHEQLPLYYIMCVDWEDAHVMRFLPGMTGTLYLDEPLEGLPHPQGWRWTLKPQLPMDSVYGNLAFLVTRPKSEYEEIRTAPSPGTDMLRFSNYNVWLHPDTNHASARRLVDCATKLRTSTGPRWDEMRQTVQNRDQPEGKAHGLFDRATHPKAEREIDGLKESLSDGQKAAIDHIKQSKQLIAQIQGPPGTGKTTLAAAIVRTLHARRIKVACFAPTDAGVDSLANMVEAQAPHIHAIRYNSIGEESRPTVERTSQHPPANVPPEGNDAVSNLQMGVIMDDYGPELTKDHLKEQIIWAEVETDIMKEDTDWLSSNSRRFNHRTMNLSLRTMEAAGMLNQNRTIKAIKPDLCPMAYQALVDTFYGDYTLEDYAQCLESPGEQLPTSEGQRIDRMERLSAQNFGSILKAAFETRLRATTVVLTNCISAADSLLRKNFHPEVILVDEAAKASELELLLTIIHNINTVTLVVFIGDPKHLSPCVESRRVTRVDGRPFNPFAGQLAYSLMARLYESGYPTATLSEQYRMADKLCYISNELFYGGLVTNADSARMEKRESARRAVDFLRIKYNLDTDTPQLFVHVVDSVCVRTPDMSRYNAYNAIAGMSVIRDLILGEVFTAPQITVLSFHQGQCRYYREAIVRASSLPEWKGMNIDQICVRTVDSAHGSEFECVILDLVLSKLRIGGPGIVASSGRINLALTRCRSMQVTIGDIFCLEDEVAATADPGGMLEAPSWAWDTKLVRLFDIYWYQKEATITLDPNTLATKKLVDFKAAEVDRQRVKDLIKKRK